MLLATTGCPAQFAPDPTDLIEMTTCMLHTTHADDSRDLPEMDRVVRGCVLKHRIVDNGVENHHDFDGWRNAKYGSLPEPHDRP